MSADEAFRHPRRRPIYGDFLPVSGRTGGVRALLVRFRHRSSEHGVWWCRRIAVADGLRGPVDPSGGRCAGFSRGRRILPRWGFVRRRRRWPALPGTRLSRGAVLRDHRRQLHAVRGLVPLLRRPGPMWRRLRLRSADRPVLASVHEPRRLPQSSAAVRPGPGCLHPVLPGRALHAGNVLRQRLLCAVRVLPLSASAARGRSPRRALRLRTPAARCRLVRRRP